jgi:hypothetical protein
VIADALILKTSIAYKVRLRSLVIFWPYLYREHILVSVAHTARAEIITLWDKKIGVMIKWWHRLTEKSGSSKTDLSDAMSGSSAQTPTYQTLGFAHQNASTSTAPLSFSFQQPNERTVYTKPAQDVPIDINSLRGTRLYRIGFHFVSIQSPCPSFHAANIRSFRFLFATVPQDRRRDLLLRDLYHGKPHLVTETETLPQGHYVIALEHLGYSIIEWARELDLTEGRTLFEHRLETWAGCYPDKEEVQTTRKWIREAAGYDEAKGVYPEE